MPREFGMGMHQWKVVTGAPYSAQVNNSLVETLSDGNTIQRTTTGQVARDSQGRMYAQETITHGPLGSGTPQTITFITDPVAGYSYVLNASTKIAMRRPFKAPTGDASARQQNERGPQESANVVQTDLGTQAINGANAHGKKVTHTIPAGAIGNAQPIVETSETWYSPELQVVVLSKRNDPRSGQATYTLNNIQRGDPNAVLFQVPSDYTIQDAPAAPHGPRGEHGPPPPPQ